MRREGFPRRLRLSRRREFLRVQRSGRKLHTRHFMVFVWSRSKPGDDRSTEDETPARVGVTVTRKVANAVGRNRIKRLVREAFRRVRGQLPPGIDLVWVAKRDAAQVSYAEVAEQMQDVASRLAKAATGTAR